MDGMTILLIIFQEGVSVDLRKKDLLQYKYIGRLLDSFFWKGHRGKGRWEGPTGLSGTLSLLISTKKIYII
ncbi:hypothetical protein EMCRGX_G001680 [Ephydatia muelleri]|eukprot:Em0001g1507a